MLTQILDTSAFIQGHTPSETAYTVPLVIAEIRNQFQRMRAENLETTGKLRVITPSEQFTEKIESITKELGESHVLSDTDKQVLALGLQLTEEGNIPVIVSDDYSVQNLADKLGIMFRSLANQGIKKRIVWMIYCPGCRKQYDSPPEDNVCIICGTEIKRKPRR